MNPSTPLSRLSFFSKMRKLGYSKSRLQMTRAGITYTKGEGRWRTSVTVPKSHSSTFTILGGGGITGIFHEHRPERAVSWGISIVPSELGASNMLEVCLGICSGTITRR